MTYKMTREKKVGEIVPTQKRKRHWRKKWEACQILPEKREKQGGERQEEEEEGEEEKERDNAMSVQNISSWCTICLCLSPVSFRIWKPFSRSFLYQNQQRRLWNRKTGNYQNNQIISRSGKPDQKKSAAFRNLVKKANSGNHFVDLGKRLYQALFATWITFSLLRTPDKFSKLVKIPGKKRTWLHSSVYRQHNNGILLITYLHIHPGNRRRSYSA